MNIPKAANVTVTLDEDTFAIFREASEIVERAGIRVPTNQLVQVMLNAESHVSVPAKSLSSSSNLSCNRSADCAATPSKTRTTTKSPT